MTEFRVILGKVRILEEAAIEEGEAVCFEHENSEAGLTEE